MKELKEAYKILKSIQMGSESKVYEQKALEAFKACKACVEAAILLNYFEPNKEDKIKNIKEVIKTIDETLKNKDKDENLKVNLIKAKEELVKLLMDDERYNESLEVLETLPDNVGETKFKKMSLYAYFEDEEIVSYYHDLIDSAMDYGYICLSFPYMIYQYKKKNFDDVKTIFKKIVDINEDIAGVLKGEIKENDDPSDLTKSALSVLKDNSFLINSTPGIIELLITLC